MRKSRERKLVLLAGVSALALMLTAAPVDIDGLADLAPWQTAQAKSGSSCFLAGTLVAMADGGARKIEEIVAGDMVLGRDGGVNRVVGIETPRLDGRLLYAFNGGRPFVTAEHPFASPNGWRAIDPEATRGETPGFPVTRLMRGDLVAVLAGPQAQARGGAAVAYALGAVVYLPLARIRAVRAEPETIVYNLLLDGDHSYFADGYLVHNKGGGGEGGGGSGSGGSGSSGSGSSGSGSGGSDDADDDGHSGSGSSDSDDADDDDNSGSGSSSKGSDDDDDDHDRNDDKDDDDSDDHSQGGSIGDLGQVGDDLSEAEEQSAISKGWQ